MVDILPKGDMLTDDSLQLLKKQGIPFQPIGQEGSLRVVVQGDELNIEVLRRLGFRLGHGRGAIRYLLYYQGHFCGVVM